MSNVDVYDIPSGGTFGYTATTDPTADSSTHTLNVGGSFGGFMPVQSASIPNMQMRRPYPTVLSTSSTLTKLRLLTSRQQSIELPSLANSPGINKYYAQMTARLSVTDSTTPQITYAAMYYAVQNPGTGTQIASGVGWTSTSPVWTVTVAGAVLQSSDPPGGENTQQTPIIELTNMTLNPTYVCKLGWVTWTTDPLQGFIIPGTIVAFSK